jgi:hypothetical protein
MPSFVMVDGKEKKYLRAFCEFAIDFTNPENCDLKRDFADEKGGFVTQKC